MPLPSLFSDPGRARKTGERTSRSAGNSTKTSTKTHHSTRPRSLSKKTTKPTSSTPPKSPPPPGQSPDTLDSASVENIPPPPGLPAEVQEDPKPEELPPLPESVAPSPASSFSHLPEASSLSSSAILPARSPNSLEVQTNPPAPTVEDEVSEVGIEHYLVEQPSPEPIEEFFDLGEDTRSKSGRASPDLQRDPSPSPSRISISSVHSERNASDDTPRGPVYTSQGESPSYFQHSSSAPEPLPAHYHSSYHPVERFFPPQHPAPQYYPMPHPQSRFVPSLHPGPLVSVQGQGFPPHFSPPPPPPPLATFAPPSHRPFPMAALQGGQLERQSSGGSRGSLAGDSAVQLSPMTGFLRSVGSSEGSGGGAASIGDEGIELTQRIQSTMANMANISAALPDLHQLLTRYHDTHGQLGHREELLRRAEVQQAEALRQKEQHIHSLAKQIDGQAAKHSAESSKLRLEIGNLEEKHKELVDSLHATERAKLELQEKKASLEIEKVDLERKAVKDHEVLREDLERWKNTMMENFSRRKQMQEEDFERRLQGLEISHGREKEEMNERFIKECEILRAGFTQQKAELEGRLLARHEEERQTWSMQRDELERRLDQHRIEWNKRLEDQKCALQEEHIKDQERLQTEIQRCNEERIASEAARELIQADWSKDRSDYERMTADLRADIDRLGKEKDKLQRMVETFGDVTDIKGKGDAYYTDAFRMLAKQIVDLSEEHFGKLETPPPEEVMSRVPSNIPSFLANTPASRQLRSAYIQHVVSDTLCYRVFQPFLFSLGRRYDKADGLFQAMSTELRNKSRHKEAVWRQHTLYAAYTASTAKKATNAAAGAVVEEIVDHIRHFAEPGQLDLIYASVRRIVKIAAETWRYARLEREMITARMPPADATDEDDSDWPPPAGESWSSSSSSSSSFLPSSSSPSDRKTLEPLANSGPTNILLLLRLLPIISREPIHESLQDDDDDDDDDDCDQKNKLKDNGCRYSQGVALYSDSKPVLARLQELQTRSLNRDESTATAAAFPTRTTTTTTAMATATGMPTSSRRERPQSPRAHDAAAGSRSVAGSRSISRSRNTKTRATTIGSSSSSSPPAPPLSSPPPSSPRTESRDARARAASTARTAASRPTSPMSNSDVWAAPPPPLSSRPGSRPTSVMMTTAKPELSDWS